MLSSKQSGQARLKADAVSRTAIFAHLRSSYVTQAQFVPFVGSGPSHAKGLVPDPGAVAGTGRFLREDGIWTNQLGANGGTNGALTLNGSTSGFTTLTVGATGGAAFLTNGLVLGGPGALSGTLNLRGATSGASNIAVNPTSGILQINSGQTSNSIPLQVFDNCSGTFVIQQIINQASAASTAAGLQLVTNLANCNATIELFQNSGTTAEVQFQWGTAVTNGFILNSASLGNVATFIGGMQLGTPGGGDLGVGNLNVSSGVFLNATGYTNPDYVLEYHFTGKIEKYADKPGAKAYKGRPNLKDLKRHLEETFRLPGIEDKPTDIFERADIALEKIEELFLYMFDLEERVERVERALHDRLID